MTLEDISNLSQAIAALAVVVSLIYLALQTRQSARNQRAMMHSARAQSIRDSFYRMGDPSFAAIWRAGVAAAPDMSLDEAQQFMFFARAQFASFQEHFLDWRAGLLDDDRWSATRAGMAAVLATPGYRAVYRLSRIAQHVEFRALGDILFDDAKGKPFPDPASTWLALAAEERAALTQGGAP